MSNISHGTISSIKRLTFGMPLTIITGLTFGVMLVPIATFVVDWVEDRYDAAYPVVEMTGTLLSQQTGEAIIALDGRKIRDCIYLRTRAYAIDSTGHLNDTFIARVDMPETGETRPAGDFRGGMWRVWPLPNSRGIVVYTNHLCGSRVVVTKVANINLTKGGAAP